MCYTRQPGTRPNPVYKQASAQGFPGGFGGPDWDRNYPPQVGRPLKPELFLQHNLDWQTNTLGEFSDVEINRVLLLQWLGGVEGVQNPNEAAPKDGDPPSQTEQAKQETKTKHADPTVDGPTKGKAGRKLGSGSYESHDKPLLEEMKTLINDGAASSIYGAALLVASRAKGGGGEPSKAKRLARRFQESDIAD